MTDLVSQDIDLRGSKCLVAGGSGFLGSYICEKLRARGVSKVFAPKSSEVDLCDDAACKTMFSIFRPDYVFHIAAEVGGIAANKANPGRYFFSNMKMTLNVIECSRIFCVKKLVHTGSVSSYPKDSSLPLREENLWNGYPGDYVCSYGIAKKAAITMLQQYRLQYNFCGIHLILTNLYGPRDKFDLESGHVIPSLVRKFVLAKNTNEKYVEIWGTGVATRDFLHVSDCAEGVILAMEKYNGNEPCNLGSAIEVSIKDIAEKLKSITKFEGEIKWDTSRPDGPLRRVLDTERAQNFFGFIPVMSIDDGLYETVEYWRRVCEDGRE